MSMTKEEVFEVFRYYASKEFEDIPENESEIDCEFSDEFNKKMEKLLKRVSYDRTHIVSWARRKVVMVAATIILVFVGMMSVGAIREPVVEFVYNIYEEFMEIFFEGDTKNKITYRFSLSEIPEGFVETQIMSEDSINVVRYENKQNGNIIELAQCITENISVSLDNKHGHIKILDINGEKVNVYINDYGDSYYAFWCKESYCITLTYSGVITVEDFTEIIKSIY